MAGEHRSHKRAKRNGKRSRGVHRANPRHPEPYTWLGAGALTLGMGAAMASGSGIAPADPSATGSSSPALSSGAGATSGTRTGSSAHSESPKPKGTRPNRAVSSSGGNLPAATGTTTGTSSTTPATSPRVTVSSAPAHCTPPDSTPSQGAVVTAVVHHDVVTVPTEVHTVLAAVSPDPKSGSS